MTWQRKLQPRYLHWKSPHRAMRGGPLPAHPRGQVTETCTLRENRDEAELSPAPYATSSKTADERPLDTHLCMPGAGSTQHPGVRPRGCQPCQGRGLSTGCAASLFVSRQPSAVRPLRKNSTWKSENKDKKNQEEAENTNTQENIRRGWCCGAAC